MPRITLDLDRATVGRNRKNAAAVAAQRQRRRKPQKLAGHDAFRHPDIGDNLFSRFAAARQRPGPYEPQIAEVRSGG